jgi:F420H(2)-dependent quinone reductase
VDPRRVSTLLSTRLFNPLVKAATNAGLAVPGIAILDTTGRNSWIVAEHGRKASYVRNIEADPRVRIKIGRQRRTGTAHPHAGRRPTSAPARDAGRRVRTSRRGRCRQTASPPPAA